MDTERVAVVTGGSRGIGLAIAAALVSSGARVCITGRKREGIDEALTELDAGERAIGIAGAAHDPHHRAEAVEEVIARFGRLDILVNGAATNPQYGPIVEADLGAVEKVFEVNVVAALGWAQEAWRAWMGGHGGAILNVASLGGLRTMPRTGAYNASKAALIHLTRQLALELAPGVRVNAVAPAVVQTRFSRALYEGREEAVAASYPLRRLGVPEDVAGVARFLVSDEAAWVTGEVVTIDGGVSLTGWDG